MPTTRSPIRISFTSSEAPAAREAVDVLRRRYSPVAFDSADVVVAVGGDGALIDALHRVLALPEDASRPSADQRQFLEVSAVEITEAQDRPLRLLFDSGHALDERVLREQFAF